MDQLFEEIETAINQRLWVLALAGTLALPDMCAAIQASNGRTNGDRYRAWVSEHLLDQYTYLDPEELWQMRCSLLHQARSSASKTKRVVFIGPNSAVMIHNSLMESEGGDILLLDLPTFARDVIGAVRSWRDKAKHTENYKKNSKHVVQWHAGGYGGFLEGAAVLA